jgi:hypothetical protein
MLSNLTISDIFCSYRLWGTRGTNPIRGADTQLDGDRAMGNVMPCEWRIWNDVLALSGCKWRHIHCFSQSCASAPLFALVFTPVPHWHKNNFTTVQGSGEKVFWWQDSKCRCPLLTKWLGTNLGYHGLTVPITGNPRFHSISYTYLQDYSDPTKKVVTQTHNAKGVLCLALAGTFMVTGSEDCSVTLYDKLMFAR